MKTKKSRLLTSFYLLILTPFLMADIGPKPTMEFELIYHESPPPILTGYDLYLCDDNSCTDPYQLEELGPEYFECTQDACTTMAYLFPSFMYITLEFADGTTRKSTIFENENYHNQYEVLVWQDYLKVNLISSSDYDGIIPKSHPFLDAISQYGCIYIIVIGLIGLLIFLNVRKSRNQTNGSGKSLITSAYS